MRSSGWWRKAAEEPGKEISVSNKLKQKKLATDHHSIQVIVHLRDLIDLTEESDAKCWKHRDGSRHQHSLPSRPLEIEEAFHGKLSAVGSRHGWALASGEDSDCPNVHRRHSEAAAEEDSALVNVGVESFPNENRFRLVDQRRFIGALLDYVGVGLAVKSVSEHTHDEDVDDEGNEQRDAGFDEEIIIRFLDRSFVLPVDVSRLHKRRVQIKIVRHDDRTDDSHSLQQHLRVAVRAPRNQRTFRNLSQLGPHDSEFISERYRHQRYEKPKENFQLAKPIFV